MVRLIAFATALVVLAGTALAADPAPGSPNSSPVNDDALLGVVRRYADTMIDRGRDTYGPQKSGLLLSAMDRQTLAPLIVRPEPPGGIRRGDRSGRPWSALTGANPHLDENLLRILYVLSEITGDAEYGRVADEELAWFFKNTLSPSTSLLPWGEHLSWDVMRDEPISGGDERMHEFARPWVLWERCYSLAPDECRRFAVGLWEHQIADHRTGAFDRHAPYFEHGPVDGKDFPRHAGFYIATWAYAYKHAPDRTFLRAIETLLARFERKRVQKDGTQIATIGPLDCDTAAGLVPEPLAGRLRAFAAKEDELLVPALKEQLELTAATAVAPPGASKASASAKLPPPPPPLWQNGYAASTQASTAMFCLARFEQTHDPAYRDLLVAIADRYVDAWPEEDLDVWPMAFGHAISAEVAAYRFTGRAGYLRQAQRLARVAVERFWQDNPLPRASFKTGHYEAITGADSLALALLEVHAASRPSSVVIPSNTIDR